MSTSLRAVPVGALALAVLSLLVAPRVALGAQVNIGMGANYFTPSQIAVNAGDTVSWNNTSSIPHTVTALDGRFDSGDMQPGTTFSRTFTSPGTFSYRCLYHPGMVGTISVFGAPAAPPPPPQPQVYTPPPQYVSSPVPQAQVPSSTIDQLRAQAQALLARVQQLQAQLGGAATPAGRSSTYDSSSCPLIGRTLNQGTTGDDVRRLQQFLARDTDIYPEGLVTGYYGSLTEAAVRRWQVKYNIVSSGTPETTGYGQVGPRTAAAISILCTTGSYGGIPGPGSLPLNVGGFIQVTPVTGSAPLNIAVQATVNTINSCSGATYVVDYGDGTIPAQIAVPSGNCTQMVQTLAHQYRYGGTYLVTLSAGSHRTSATVRVYGPGPPAPTPVPPPQPPPVAAQDSVSASPSSGSAPLSVVFKGTINGLASCSGGSYFLDFGDNTSTTVAYPADSCRAFSFETTHSYTSGGNFIARLYRGSDASSPPVSQASVSVTGPAPSTTWGIVSVTPAVGGNPFVISIQIEYPACAAYSIDWGDGTIPASTPSQTGCAGGTSSATVSHTYATGGNYTVSLRDGNGNVKASSGVVII